MRRRSWLSILAALALTSFAGAGSVLPEMGKHLEFGRRCAEVGDAIGAQACSQLILLERLRVYVDGTGATSEALGGIQSATRTWSQVLNGEVEFVFVRTREEAQVIVTFERELGSGQTAYGGFTRWKRRLSTRDWSLNATMQIRTHAPTGRPMSTAQVTHAALHEFGHILGLDDSSAQGDAMGPLDLRAPVQAPRSAELAKLNALRAHARGLCAAKPTSRVVRSSPAGTLP